MPCYCVIGRNLRAIKFIIILFFIVFVSGCANIPVNKIEPTVIFSEINAPSTKVFSVIKDVLANYKNCQFIKEDKNQGAIVITQRYHAIVKGINALGTVISGSWITEEYDFRIIPVGQKSQLFLSILILLHRPDYVETLKVNDKTYKEMLDIIQEIKMKAEK